MFEGIPIFLMILVMCVSRSKSDELCSLSGRDDVLKSAITFERIFSLSQGVLIWQSAPQSNMYCIIDSSDMGDTAMYFISGYNIRAFFKKEIPSMFGSIRSKITASGFARESDINADSASE